MQILATSDGNASRVDSKNTLGQDEQPFYSNLRLVALWWITVLSCGESNSEAGTVLRLLSATASEEAALQHAKLGAMVDLAVPVLDGMDGSGGVRSYSPNEDRGGCLFHLRGGP